MQILIFKEKHGDRIYNASSRDKILRAMAYTFNGRYNDRWYDTNSSYNDKKLAELELQKPSFTEESITEIADSLKSIAKKQWDDYKRKKKFHADAIQECELITKLYEEQDAEAIYDFMKSHCDGEYEGWELEDVELAPPLENKPTYCLVGQTKQDGQPIKKYYIGSHNTECFSENKTDAIRYLVYEDAEAERTRLQECRCQTGLVFKDWRLYIRILKD